MSEPTTANFPSSIANDTSLLGDPTSLQQFTLDGLHNDSITTITTTGAIAGMNSPGYILIEDELIHFTGISGADFTGCTRGADGTSAASHADATSIYHTIAANYWKQLKKELIAAQTTLFGMITDGWIDANETWTYASATTFTVSGDVTDKYPVGTRLKYTQTTVKYATVVSRVYSSPNTTITVAENDDYTIANAAITSPYYSYLVKPAGYPEWFSYTPTYTGFSADPGINSKYQIVGTTVNVLENQISSGTSNSVLFKITLPVQAKNVTNLYWGGTCFYAKDNSVTLTGASKWQIVPGGTTVDLYSDMAGAAWTAANDKRARIMYSYQI